MKTRLSKEDWLREAIDVLSREGSGRLHLEQLCQALGVSKGSFYWHFKDRDEFLRSIVEYWEDYFTRRVVREVDARGGSTKARLELLLKLVVEEDLAGYDSAFDAWAAHEPVILPQVREVHRVRHAYVQRLFAEMGFKGRDLELRTQALLGFMKYRSAHSLNWPHLRDPGSIKKQLAFFTRR